MRVISNPLEIINRYKDIAYEDSGFCMEGDDFIYFNIPKNASRVMRHITLRRGGKEIKTRDVKNLHKFKFAIIRDPFERLLSGYIELWYRRKKRIKELPLKDNLGLIPVFIKRLRESFFDPHIVPQTQFLPVEMDLYLILEHLEEDYKKLGWNNKLFFGYSKEGKEELREHFLKHIDTIREIYHKDFELYDKKNPYKAN